MDRRDAMIWVGALLAGGAARAQAWPSRPVKLVSPFAAGGGSDFLGRFLSVKLGAALGQPVIVENRAGAGGTIGTDFVAKSPADGYTVLIGSNGPLALIPGMQPKLQYDPQRDLQPVALLTRQPFVFLVGPKVTAKDFGDLLEQARARPDSINFGTAGNGSAPHLAVELLKVQARVRMTHVPYKGPSLALNDLAAGQIEMAVADANTAAPLVRQGRLRALAVSTRTRSPILPDVPTVAESGVPGYDVAGWFGALVPAGTPRAIVDRLHAELVKAMSTPEARDALGGLGGELLATTPEEFTAHIRSEAERWRKLIQTAGIKMDS
jgi:tripartite-type tricarboxylate transporter receptor subunit TctC